MGMSSLSGSEVLATYPVITSWTTRKLRVKYEITGGTDHTVLAKALVV